MCFSATASAVTFLVGSGASWSASLRQEPEFGIFWFTVSLMQLVELVIHLTQDQCQTSQTLAIGLHLALLTTLIGQPLSYAFYVREKHSREAGKLLLVHWIVATLLRAINIYEYLTNGVTHDLFALMDHPPSISTLDSSYCISKGPGGHLAWNHGFININSPFLPHYADVLLGVAVPAFVYQPRLALVAFLLDPLAHFVSGWSHREGGSVWCWMIHVYAFIEVYQQIAFQRKKKK